MTAQGGSSVWTDAEAARAHFRSQVEQAQQRAATAKSMAEQIQHLKATAVSTDRSVHATADATGSLLDLQLNDAALDLEPRALAALILRTTVQARHRAGEQAIKIVADAFGDESGPAQAMRKEIDDRESARSDNGITY